MIDHPLTILYVENDPNDVVLLRVGFQRLHAPFHLIAVPDGDKAQAYLGGQGPYADRSLFPWPDLVIMDLKMPRKGGLEVTWWIRSQPALEGIPIVILTSSEQPKDRAASLEAGANGFFIKPVGLDELEVVVREISHQFLHLPA